MMVDGVHQYCFLSTMKGTVSIIVIIVVIVINITHHLDVLLPPPNHCSGAIDRKCLGKSKCHRKPNWHSTQICTLAYSCLLYTSRCV